MRWKPWENPTMEKIARWLESTGRSINSFLYSPSGRTTKNLLKKVDRGLGTLTSFWGRPIDLRDIILVVLTSYTAMDKISVLAFDPNPYITDNYITAILVPVALAYPAWLIARLFLPILKWAFRPVSTDHLLTSILGGILVNVYFLAMLSSSALVSIRVLRDLRYVIMMTS